MDEKQLLEALRTIVREEVGSVEQRLNDRLDSIEANLNKRIDTVEVAVLETAQNVKDIKARYSETETDVRLLKKIVSK